MSRRSAGFSGLSLAAVALALALGATATQAAPRPLSDSEMSAVRGADGSILAGVTSSPAAAPGDRDALGRGLAAAFSSSTGATLLDAAGFASALAANGLTTRLIAGYDGQPVTQTRVDAAPVTFSFDVAAILQTTTGLSYSGPSMGTITLKDFDARGTTIWAWQHH